MHPVKYELHNNLDPHLPLIFGYREILKNSNNAVYLHWHDCIELIYCSSGEGWIRSGAKHIEIKEGELVIVNSGNIHDLFSNENCGVYSLNPNDALFAPFHLDLHNYLFEEKITNPDTIASFKRIINEMTLKKDSFYKQAAHIEIVSLALKLAREHGVSESGATQSNEDRRMKMSKEVICYLREHFLESIFIDDICARIGYSKFYLCRSFKETTGFTITQYINSIRCQNARNLLLSGKCNVSESAELSGFSNGSYFTKTYKSVFGKLPSEETIKRE